MLTRLVLSLLAPMLVTTSLYAADDLPKAEPAPGTCFVYKVDEDTGLDKDPASAFISRVDVQPLQFKLGTKPLPETRLRIGILAKDQTGPIPNDISAACTGEGLTFSCSMKCGEKVVGKFRAEALPTKPTEPKANFLRLVIEAPTLLNACTEGKEPYTVPPELTGLQIILKGAEPTSCFR